MVLFITLTLVTAGFVIGGLVARNNKKEADIAAKKLEDLALTLTKAAENAAVEIKQFTDSKADEVSVAKPAKRARKPKNS
jgi:hypothetical protein